MLQINSSCCNISYRANIKLSRVHIKVYQSQGKVLLLHDNNLTSPQRSDYKSTVLKSSQMIANGSGAHIQVTTSGTHVNLTEIVILTMFFALFFYSIFSLISIWNRTYGDIGPSSYYFYEHAEPDSPVMSRSASYSRQASLQSRRMSRRGL